MTDAQIRLALFGLGLTMAFLSVRILLTLEFKKPKIEKRSNAQ
jgi:hypothetical protein